MFLAGRVEIQVSLCCSERNIDDLLKKEEIWVPRVLSSLESETEYKYSDEKQNMVWITLKYDKLLQSQPHRYIM